MRARTHRLLLQAHRQKVVQQFCYSVNEATQAVTGPRHPVEPLSHAGFEHLHKPFDVAEVGRWRACPVLLWARVCARASALTCWARCAGRGCRCASRAATSSPSLCASSSEGAAATAELRGLRASAAGVRFHDAPKAYSVRTVAPPAPLETSATTYRCRAGQPGRAAAFPATGHPPQPKQARGSARGRSGLHAALMGRGRACAPTPGAASQCGHRGRVLPRQQWRHCCRGLPAHCLPLCCWNAAPSYCTHLSPPSQVRAFVWRQRWGPPSPPSPRPGPAAAAVC